ncbi:MAG TPA: hypothetical protein VJN43_04580 [Bryobacteraceae bacterium]|nr:hypothetical protein [Bryobacteraceae bacterium]
MNTRKFLAAFVALSGWLAWAPSASAHRLDEYLQATRLSIAMDRVDLEIDLTPGTSIADKVLAWIDTNGDGRISDAEAEAYAEEMLRSVTLKVDGRPASIALVMNSFPEWSDVRLGVGRIRLRAAAKILSAPGQHVISFLNTHRPESSVYLVNALVPDNPRIQLGQPRRDYAQLGMTLEYSVVGEVSPVARTWALLGGLVMAVGLFLRLAYTLTRPAGTGHCCRLLPGPEFNPSQQGSRCAFLSKSDQTKFPSPCSEAVMCVARCFRRRWFAVGQVRAGIRHTSTWSETVFCEVTAVKVAIRQLDEKRPLVNVALRAHCRNPEVEVSVDALSQSG